MNDAEAIRKFLADEKMLVSTFACNEGDTHQNWLDVIDALQKAVEALDDYENVEDGQYLSTSSTNIVAQEALASIRKTLRPTCQSRCVANSEK